MNNISLFVYNIYIDTDSTDCKKITDYYVEKNLHELIIGTKYRYHIKIIYVASCQKWGFAQTKFNSKDKIYVNVNQIILNGLYPKEEKNPKLVLGAKYSCNLALNSYRNIKYKAENLRHIYKSKVQHIPVIKQKSRYFPQQIFYMRNTDGIIQQYDQSHNFFSNNLKDFANQLIHYDIDPKDIMYVLSSINYHKRYSGEYIKMIEFMEIIEKVDEYQSTCKMKLMLIKNRMGKIVNLDGVNHLQSSSVKELMNYFMIGELKKFDINCLNIAKAIAFLNKSNITSDVIQTTNSKEIIQYISQHQQSKGII